MARQLNYGKVSEVVIFTRYLGAHCLTDDTVGKIIVEMNNYFEGQNYDMSVIWICNSESSEPPHVWGTNNPEIIRGIQDDIIRKWDNSLHRMMYDKQ